MNFKKLIENSRSTYLDANFDLINYIEIEAEELFKNLEVLNSVDTEGVEPMFWIHQDDEKSVDLLREDNPVHEGFSSEFAFKNIGEVQNNLVVLSRVVGGKKKR